MIRIQRTEESVKKFKKALCRAIMDACIMQDSLSISSGQNFDEMAMDSDDILDLESIVIKFTNVQMHNTESFWHKVERYMREAN